MKEIRWWSHARVRLVERGIDVKLVQAALEQPDQTILTGRRKIVHKRYHNSRCHKEYLLRVFIEEDAQGQVIRSVYRTSKITKYWRDDL